jgi:hypothetical protein
VLEVEDQRPAPDPLEVSCLVRIADDSNRFMPRLREQPLQDQSDLTVTSGDDNLHFALLPYVVPVGACRSCGRT